MKSRAWLALAGLCFSATLTAQEDPGLVLVNRFVSEIETFQGSFRQSLLDADGELIEEMRGTVEIRRPGQFRWDSTEPYEQWLIADGLNIWSYDLDLEQVTVKAQAEALDNTPAMILSGANTALDQFNFVESYEEAGYRWVRLEPVDRNSGFTRMEMGFLEGDLNRLVFFDSLAQTTLVQLDEVRINEDIDATRFEFDVPESVDLIGTPAEASAD